jgi:hypothetical protein
MKEYKIKLKLMAKKAKKMCPAWKCRYAYPGQRRFVNGFKIAKSVQLQWNPPESVRYLCL